MGVFSPIIPIWILILAYILCLIVCGKKKAKNIVLITLVFLTMLLVDMRFKSFSENVNVASNNLDIMFVIDSTISMIAEDYNGNERRLDAVISDVETIVKELSGSKFSIIVFNDKARVLAPYTKDGNIVINYLKSLSIPVVLYARGSDINAPIETIYDTLSNYSPEKNRKKILFFISDGEITNGKPLESYAKIKNLIDYGAVLGYGSSAGGKMKIKTYTIDKEAEYIQDRTAGYPYPTAISRIDESNLKSIAKDMGVKYIHMTSHNDVNEVINGAKAIATTEATNEVVESYEDTYYLYAIPLLALFTYISIDTKKKMN